MDDLVGLGKATEKMLDVVARGIGVLHRPRSIRVEADARAYEMRVLGEAALDVEKAKAAHQLSLAVDTKLAMAEADEQLAARARERLVQTEIQRQRNVEEIVQLAIEAPPTAVSDEPVDDDWTRTLFRYGQDVSDATMQRVWAQVLNGEVAQPGSYSLRALRALSTLTKSEVAAFQRLCRLSDEKGRIPSPPNVGEDGGFQRRHGWFEPDGISDQTVQLLQEAGLVAEGTAPLAAVRMVAEPASLTDLLVLRLPIAGCTAVFTCLEASQRTLELYCMRLTSIGRELARLTDADFDKTYLQRVAAAYAVAFRVEQLSELDILSAQYRQDVYTEYRYSRRRT